MTDIRIVAEGPRVAGGPSEPFTLRAVVRRESIFGGDLPAVPVLILLLGTDTVQLWPAHRAQLLELSRSLAEAAESLP